LGAREKGREMSNRAMYRLRFTACAVTLMVVVTGSCQRSEESGPASTPLCMVSTDSGAEMVLVPAGKFVMGSGEGKPDETPHEVTLDAFLMDRTEVTQAQYKKYIVADPAHFKGANRPVEQISWADAALYCNARSKAEGFKPCYDEATAKCDFGRTATACLLRRNGSTPAARAARPSTASGPMRGPWLNTPGSARTRRSRRSRWPRRSRTRGDSMTCMGTSPSGATTCMSPTTTQKARREPSRPGRRREVCAPGRGLEFPGGKLSQRRPGRRKSGLSGCLFPSRRPGVPLRAECSARVDGRR